MILYCGEDCTSALFTVTALTAADKPRATVVRLDAYFIVDTAAFKSDSTAAVQCSFPIFWISSFVSQFAFFRGLPGFRLLVLFSSFSSAVDAGDESTGTSCIACSLADVSPVFASSTGLFDVEVSER